MEALRKGQRGLLGMLAWAAAAIMLQALVVPPSPALAQGANMTVHACRRIEIRSVGSRRGSAWENGPCAPC